MLKKITIDQAKVGMYIHELCGSWLDNPFWASSFALDGVAALDKLRESGIAEMWIDTDKGSDVEAEVKTMAPREADVSTPSVPVPRFAFTPQPASSTAEEMSRATQILQRSRSALTAMFADARMGKVAHPAQSMPLVEEIANSVIRNPGALVSLVRLKQADDYTYMHSVAVCAMMVALARQLDFDDEQVRQCGMAGLLHDIGKMAISSALLNKPGKLTDEEFSDVKRHPVAGYDLLKSVDTAHPITLDVCLHHHERVDGRGYPHGLVGEAISIHARMGAVCDVYDAITSNRPYKAGWSPAVSLRKMAEWSKDGHFDPTIFGAFVKCVGIYPVGTLLRLKSDRLAVVIDNSNSLLKPIVRVFFSIKSKAYIQPLTLNLDRAESRDAIASHEEVEKWGLADIARFWAVQGN
ncbi:MAG: HD-GYP domain-containing protein [Massilia sp.]